jgi:acyl-CoA synthetase (AMP-forming)/AMP-acid ligase II
MLTSGTTGPSSLVSQRPAPLALARISLALVDRLGVRSGHSTLLTVPLFHGHGLATLALTMAMGSPLHLVASTRGRDLLDRIDDDRIAVAVVVPTILRRLLDAAGGRGEARPTSLTAIVCGSAPLSAATAVDTLATFGPVLFNLYGASESGLVSLATPIDLSAEPDTVGRVLPGVRVRIVDDTGCDVPSGAAGSVVVFCDQVRDGFDTGDVGHFDEAGRLFVHGRSDDLIIRGGENFFPLMLEDRIVRDIDSIAECAVVAVPDDTEFESSLHLFVVVVPASEVTEASLLAELAELLPRALRPTVVAIVDSLPRNLSGEIVRRRLGEQSR